MRISDWSSDVCSSDLPPVQDRVPGAPGVARCRGRPMAARLPGRRPLRLRPAHHRALARGVSAALLRVRAVQALGDPQRPKGLARRLAVTARRLACALGRQRPRMARRAAPGAPRRAPGSEAHTTEPPYIIRRPYHGLRLKTRKI